jgi:hypothetical protein
MVFVAGQAEYRGCRSYHGKEWALIGPSPEPLSSAGRGKKSTLCPIAHTMSPHPKKQIKTNPLKKWTARASRKKTECITGHSGTISREAWMAIVRKRNICPQTGKAATNCQPITGFEWRIMLNPGNKTSKVRRFIWFRKKTIKKTSMVKMNSFDMTLNTGKTSCNLERMTLDVRKATRNSGRKIRNFGNMTLNFGKATCNSGDMTLNLGKTLRNLGRVTLNLGRTLRNLGKTTLHLGNMTMNSGKVIEKVEPKTGNEGISPVLAEPA